MFDVRTVEGQSGIMHLLRMQKLPKNYLLTPDTHTRTCGYRRVGGGGWGVRSVCLFFGMFCAPTNEMDDALRLIYH